MAKSVPSKSSFVRDSRDDVVHSLKDVITKKKVLVARSTGILNDLGSDGVVLSVLICISLVIRFAYLHTPSEVVFDEVHFGKFASFYLQRTYFFDIHPPLGKMLYALVGWFMKFDGSFLFEKIGEDYIANNVPYVAYRCLSASFGAIIPPLMYQILRDLNHSQYAALCAALCALFDNAVITQSRLILLDSILLGFTLLTVCAWMRFLHYDHCSFMHHSSSPSSLRTQRVYWWLWLILTGVFLGCAMSVKFVGLFVVLLIGYEAIRNLWDWLHVRHKLSMYSWIKYEFVPRACMLIALPILIFIFFFYVHLWILSKNGPGDAFMSLSFVTSLGTRDQQQSAFLFSQRIPYFSHITLRHDQTNAYLYSHAERYPLVYDDGRISSQGQQVSMGPFTPGDDNYLWQIKPASNDLEMQYLQDGQLHFVGHLDDIRLEHVNTHGELYTHDVASPLTPTLMEITAKTEVTNNANLWRIELSTKTSAPGTPLKTLTHHVKLIHHVQKTALYGHHGKLPDWAGTGRLEVNGNRGLQDLKTEWVIHHVSFPEVLQTAIQQTGYLSERDAEIQRQRPLGFWQKLRELFRAMQMHNANLKGTHPSASHPQSWFALDSGIAYWTKQQMSAVSNNNNNNKGTTDAPLMAQIYLLGNPWVWWMASFSVMWYGALQAFEGALNQRDASLVDRWVSEETWQTCRRSGLFLLVGWACHYVPFFMMERLRFLHHYLPAALFSTMMIGVVFECIFSVIVHWTARTTAKRMACRCVIVMLCAAVVYCFVIFAPLTYGRPALLLRQVTARQWRKGWNFSKAVT